MIRLAITIGAGPVGLFQAIQLKKRSPETEIIIYERREEYLRDNQLSIHRTSMTKGAIQLGDELEQATLDALNEAHETPHDPLSVWSSIFFGLRKVTRLLAHKLEKIFRTEALARGIKIVYQPITDIRQITRAHPECRYIVVADGTHSAIRKQLLGEDDVALERRPILKSIDVQYHVQGQAQYMQTPTYKQARFMVAETIGKLQEDGTSRVGLRFLVDDKTFNKFPPSDARHPVGWGEAFDTLGTDISTFIQLRRTNMGDIIPVPIPEAVSAYKIELSCYAAKQFALTQKAEDGREVGVFLVGNAAMAVPWYKSLNTGLRAASLLAAVLAKPDEDVSQKVAAYEALRGPMVKNAFNAASRKLAGVRFYRNKVRPALALSGSLPLICTFGALAIVTAPVWAPCLWAYMKLNPNARLM